MEYPTQGCLRVSQELDLRSIHVSSGGVRGVWQRHKLLNRYQRLLRLEKHYRKEKIQLSDEQIKMLERFDSEF